MPEISRFFGMAIAMFYNDHSPPHFHVAYAGRHALIIIETGKVLAGDLPPRALKLVEEWRQLHLQELLDDWSLATQHKPLRWIAPLE